jgi:DNA (cytosine-5)-methyltransferase 1
MITFGSLFSGIGGIDLGLERAGLKCLWQSEIDPYACQMLAKHWPNIPNLGDIRDIDWTTAKANQDSPSMEARAPGRHLWPTPIARDYKGAGMDGQLPTEVMKVDGSGSLNPAWVEWLMGFPEGWTDSEA